MSFGILEIWFSSGIGVGGKDFVNGMCKSGANEEWLRYSRN